MRRRNGSLHGDRKRSRMPHIVLNEEQARVVAEAREAIELRDERGKVLARVEPPVPEAEIAEAKRRLASDQRRWASSRVQEFLAVLNEIRAREGIDETRLRQVLETFRAAGPS
jgi:hypothetical protein